MRTMICLAVSALLTGCATMSSEQCAVADWYAYGYEDGAAGAPISSINRRAEACADHGIAIDRPSYRNGRNDGLWAFCTPDTGYAIGARGQAAPNVCVHHDDEDFRLAHQEGLELFGYVAAVSQAQNAVQDADVRARRISGRLREYTNGERPFEAARHNEVVLDLFAKRRWLRDVVAPYWRQEMAVAQRALADYQQRLALGDPNAGLIPPPIPSGPPIYRGPTRDDARALLVEVFEGVAIEEVARRTGG